MGRCALSLFDTGMDHIHQSGVKRSIWNSNEDELSKYNVRNVVFKSGELLTIPMLIPGRYQL